MIFTAAFAWEESGVTIRNTFLRPIMRIFFTVNPDDHAADELPGNRSPRIRMFTVLPLAWIELK